MAAPSTLRSALSKFWSLRAAAFVCPVHAVLSTRSQFSSTAASRFLSQVRMGACVMAERWGTDGRSACRLYSDNTTKQSCWKCGRETVVQTELFFCECGVVQAPATNLSYFKLFGLTESFDIDVKDLSTKYKDLQWKLHPDKFSQHSEVEKQHAASQSSLVNKAYHTLLKPLSRAVYLLTLNGLCIEESSTQTDAEFLMEIMEINETVDSVQSEEEMREVQASVQTDIDACVAQLSQAFGAGDFSTAKSLALRYTYFDSIDDKIKGHLRKQMH